MNEFPRTLKLATVWLLVGLAVFLAVQLMAERAQRPRISLLGDVIEIQRSADGHFHWPGRVNGVAVDFLVDTGATRTALPQGLAERSGLVAGARVRSDTAGGVVQGHVAQADIELDGGVRAERLPVVVLPALGAPLLGMDLLSKMRFSQHAGVLRIEPAAAGSR